MIGTNCFAWWMSLCGLLKLPVPARKWGAKGHCSKRCLHISLFIGIWPGIKYFICKWTPRIQALKPIGNGLIFMPHMDVKWVDLSRATPASVLWIIKAGIWTQLGNIVHAHCAFSCSVSSHTEWVDAVIGTRRFRGAGCRDRGISSGKWVSTGDLPFCPASPLHASRIKGFFSSSMTAPNGTRRFHQQENMWKPAQRERRRGYNRKWLLPSDIQWPNEKCERKKKQWQERPQAMKT